MPNRWFCVLTLLFLLGSSVSAQKQVTIDRAKLEQDRKAKRSASSSHRSQQSGSHRSQQSRSHRSRGFSRGQNTPQPATYLSVDNAYSKDVYRNVGPSSSYETFYVNTDGKSWTVSWLPQWCTLSNRSATSFSLYINENTTDTPRKDWLIVKSDDKEVKVHILQEAKKLNVSASINHLTIQHNIKTYGINTMVLSGDFIVTSGSDLTFHAVVTMKDEHGHDIYPSASYPAYKASNGILMAAEPTTCAPNSNVHSFRIAIPTNAMNLDHCKKKSYVQLTVRLYCEKKGEYIPGASRWKTIKAKKTSMGIKTKDS